MTMRTVTEAEHLRSLRERYQHLSEEEVHTWVADLQLAEEAVWRAKQRIRNAERALRDATRDRDFLTAQALEFSNIPHSRLAKLLGVARKTLYNRRDKALKG